VSENTLFSVFIDVFILILVSFLQSQSFVTKETNAGFDNWYAMRDEYDFTNAIKNPFMGDLKEGMHEERNCENGIGMLKETNEHMANIKEISTSNGAG